MCQHCENSQTTYTKESCGYPLEIYTIDLFEPWGGGFRIGSMHYHNSSTDRWVIGGGMDASTDYDRAADIEFCPKCGRNLKV